MTKSIISILLTLSLYSNITAGDLAKVSLSGVITDKQTGQPIPGVYIYIPDLKSGAVTDENGKYIVNNLPQTKIFLQVSFVGYRSIFETVDLNITSRIDFVLEQSAIEMNEVIIAGTSKAQEMRSTPTPIAIIKKISLLQNPSTNIIDALSAEPGISQVSTGPAISKPVIRGLGYNRVVVVNDGVRQEGQQWGDEHGIEIDENSVNKAEILKGPASLAYGSDAMAGVINLISSPVVAEGTISGNLSGNYQSNNGLAGYSADLAGNNKGFIWDTRYSYKMAHAYQNKNDGYVFNSGFKENAASALIGFNKSWGFSHLTANMYHITPGIVEGERDSATGKFIKPALINNSIEGTEIASEEDFKSYTAFVPYQKIHHYKIVLNNNFIFGNGNLKSTLGWQKNQRQEYANILEPGQYGLFFDMNTIHYDLQYNLPEKKNLEIAIGINGMDQSSRNKGAEYLIPEYNLLDFGIFTTLKKSYEKLKISGGLRYDVRSEKAMDLFLDSLEMQVEPSAPGAVEKFRGFNTSFTGLSGSIGIAYDISESLFTKFNISRGYRAPNIAESGANGVHEGTLRYEIGNPGLKAEGSWQFDYALGLNSTHISAELNLFDNNIGNYIFLAKLNSQSGADSIIEGVSAFEYISGKAHLYGGELSIDIHPHPWDWLHFENSVSMVNAVQSNQPDSTRYLPLIPPLRFQTGLKTDIEHIGSFLQNAYFKIDLDIHFSQNRVYSAYGTESPTPGYSLLNLGMGADIGQKGKTIFSIYFSASNITDVAYQDHLSRLKYAAVNNSSGRYGVYNMGRNFSIKVVIPITIRNKHSSDHE